MSHLHTSIATRHGSKYLQQLCKHFRHKVNVEFDQTTARVDFPGGVAFMFADDEGLSFFCRVDVEGKEAQIKAILDTHLIKFAWREELVIDWQDGLPEALPVADFPRIVDVRA